ncbi:MAG TPA: hypothetical protein IAA94_04660 [Candidatus Galloscillospira stercoripullorum]|nr:hypothetical protein [Candidatus Galloscillospira stercoripullorum]
MAMLERNLTGNFDAVLRALHDGVMNGSMSASFEDGAEFTTGTARCAVRMYERYSWSGGNRVALSLTLTGCGNNLHLVAITAGGSQATFFKINTWGEEAFLDTLSQVVDNL